MTRVRTSTPRERVNIVYKSHIGDRDEEIELPFRFLVLGDFTGREDTASLDQRKTIDIHRDNFNDVLSANEISIQLTVTNEISGEEGAELDVSINLERLEDFGPEAICQQVPQLRMLHDLREALVALKESRGNSPASLQQIQSLIDNPLLATGAPQGARELISRLMTEQGPGQAVDRQLVNALICELDLRIGNQIDRILHHPDFQKIESAWRGLRFLVDRTDFRENLKIDILQVQQSELREDFEDSSEIFTSGLYHHIYTAEFGQFGGKPFGTIVANYAFSTSAVDLALLRNCASVAAMAHAPFLAAASPEVFEPDSNDFTSLTYWRELAGQFEGPSYAKWRAFRESEDARYVGLLLPRFMLRSPYRAEDGPVTSFAYNENVDGDRGNYLWGSAAFALATCIAQSFVKYRWCPNIIGPSAGGLVEDLPIHTYESMGALKTKIPTEVLISERREFELSEAGFIALTMRKESNNACFFSANSVQKPKSFGTSDDAKKEEVNYRLGTQLPYMFIICRLAHYLKVLQRENIGTWKRREDLQRELTRWVEQYVVDMDDPTPAVRARKPLRRAKVIIEEVPGDAGWYKVDLKVVPHLKYMGALFTLSLVGKLDKE